MSHLAKRWLFIAHRWIGIVTCLLFAMWFFSGLVMIYVPFPSLSAAARVGALEPIDFGRVRVAPPLRDVQAAALEMRDGAPVWRLTDWAGDEAQRSAEDGGALGSIGETAAARIAARFGRARVVQVERITRDQWTVAGGFDGDRPLWKASLAGPGGRVVYVSSQRGTIVLATNARQRFWNWVGSVPHWLYPTVLRQDNAAWRQVVMWVSGPCIVGAVTGMWIGILRTRLGRRRFSGGRPIPYRGWMAWHHVAGLFGGIALIAWIFSGWLSVDPFRLFASRPITLAQQQAYAGSSESGPIDLVALAARANGARRIEFYRAAGRPLLLIDGNLSPVIPLDPHSLSEVHFTGREVIAAGKRLLPGAPLRRAEMLTRPDAYWYDAPLPVWRLRFDDRARSWLHIDPRTGRFLDKLDNRRRAYRWAFDLLHKWDVAALTGHRPVWDAWMWLLSLLGIVTSVSGIWIGYRRLTRTRPERRGVTIT